MLCKHIDKLQPQQLSNSLWAFAALNYNPTMLLPALTAAMLHCMDNYTPRQLVDIAEACVKLAYHNAELVSSVAAAASHKVQGASPQTLATLAASCAAIEAPPIPDRPLLIKALQQEAAQQLTQHITVSPSNTTSRVHVTNSSSQTAPSKPADLAVPPFQPSDMVTLVTSVASAMELDGTQGFRVHDMAKVDFWNLAGDWVVHQLASSPAAFTNKQMLDILLGYGRVQERHQPLFDAGLKVLLPISRHLNLTAAAQLALTCQEWHQVPPALLDDVIARVLRSAKGHEHAVVATAVAAVLSGDCRRASTLMNELCQQDCTGLSTRSLVQAVRALSGYLVLEQNALSSHASANEVADVHRQLQVAASVLLPKLHECSADDLTRLCAALCSLNKGRCEVGDVDGASLVAKQAAQHVSVLLGAVVTRVDAIAHDLSLSNCASCVFALLVLGSYGCSQLPDETLHLGTKLLNAATAQFASQRNLKLCAGAAAQLLGSCADCIRLGLHEPAALACVNVIAKLVEQQGASLAPSHLADLADALSKQPSCNMVVFMNIHDAAVESIERFDGHQLGRLLHAFVRVGWRDSALFYAAAQWAIRNKAAVADCDRQAIAAAIRQHSMPKQ